MVVCESVPKIGRASVHLVADAGARRHHAEIVEGALAPAQEGVALAIALHLDVDVLGKGGPAGIVIDHHRMVDHQIHRRQRVDPLRVAAGLGHGGAHGRQVDHGGHAGEVLHQHPRRAVLDLSVGTAILEPVGQGVQVLAAYGLAVLPAQQVLQQHLERHGQAIKVAQLAGGFWEAEIVVGALAHLEGLEGVQAIERGHCQLLLRRCPALVDAGVTALCRPARHGPG